MRANRFLVGMTKPNDIVANSMPEASFLITQVCLLCGIPKKRHTASMRLLHARVDSTVIALWLGHEQVSTTNIHIYADMTLKGNTIATVAPTGSAKRSLYQPTDAVMAFLESL